MYTGGGLVFTVMVLLLSDLATWEPLVLSRAPKHFTVTTVSYFLSRTTTHIYQPGPDIGTELGVFLFCDLTRHPSEQLLQHLARHGLLGVPPGRAESDSLPPPLAAAAPPVDAGGDQRVPESAKSIKMVTTNPELI